MGGRNDYAPSIALQLSSDDRAALNDYLVFFRTHAALIATSTGFPFIDSDVGDALEANEWEPYLRELRRHATRAAGAGLSYADWFEVAAHHRRIVLAVLNDVSSESSGDITSLVRGMDRLVEIAVQTIGETYFALRLQVASLRDERHAAMLEVRSFAMSALDAPSVESTRTARILLVDDDHDVLRTLGRFLRRAGYDVVEVESGSQAISILESGTFDAVVSDIHMPDGGGLDLLRVVRRVDLDVPVILISGAADVRSAAAALAYGAFRYLSKPLRLDELGATIRHAVHAHALACLRRRAVTESGNHAGAGDRAGLEVRFEQALGSLWIAFQPIFHASSGVLFGVEALLRSNEPSLPSPNAVLEAASDLGRLTGLGRRVRKLAADGIIGHEELQLFVNLHPDDLADADLVAETASLSMIAPRVILEVTERSALQASPELSSRISRLRALGFRLAVDDIGAGYSGLTSFADLTPEIVKIDMGLVRDIHTSMPRQRTVRALCNLCHEANCLVVGEGVETREEYDCLISLGCDLLQGYLLGRPHADLPFSPGEAAVSRRR